jgi:cbb3-type cytochrome oxidase subunit 3
MARIYASARKEITYGRSQSHATFFIIFIALFFICISFFMMSVHNRTREDLIETLKKEQEVMEINNRLKTELAGITQARLLELKAKERLGLTKPKEEEVLVLR